MFGFAMKILVTGASGFIGSNLCQSLLDDGHLVCGVDSYTENYSIAVKKLNCDELKLNKNFEFIEADLLLIDLKSILAGFDVIFHLAGQPNVTNSWGVDFDKYTSRNVLLTQKLLYAAKELRIEKFVNSSSSSIYGRSHLSPTREGDEKIPISPYGVTKLAAENLVTLFGSEFGMNTVSLRYFTVYGPRQRPDMAFNKLISSAVSKSRFELYGDGSQVRDFTFVNDVVSANKMAAFADLKPGTVLNIGGGSPVSMVTAISMLEEILNVQIQVDFHPLGPGNPMLTSANCSQAKKLLGWEPTVDIYNCLIAQVGWQLK